MMQFRNTLLVFLFLSLHPTLNSQCPDGILHFIDDASIAEFAAKYPNCTKLDSGLFIGPNDHMKTTRISSISGLKNIIEINGDLTIKNNPWLEDISALNSIEKVNGNVLVNSRVNVFVGLNKSMLSVVDGDLQYYAGLNKGEGQYYFPELIKIGGSLETYVFDHSSPRFPQLWRVGKNLRIQTHDVAIADNEFPVLERVEGSVNVDISYSNKDFKGFRKLKYAQSIYLNIKAKGKQIFFGDLDSCDYLSVRVHASSKISGLHKLEKIPYLEITNVSQNILSAFGNLKEAEYLRLGKNTLGKRNLFFPKLGKVDKLDLDYEGLTSILNPDLEIGTLQIKAIDVADKLYLKSNRVDVLLLKYHYTKFKILPSLDSLYCNEIEISSNSQLTTLDGFIYNNSALEKFTLASNSSLESLDGLQLRFANNSEIKISSNNSLLDCVLDSLCAVLSKDTKVYINGNKNCTKEILLKGCTNE